MKVMLLVFLFTFSFCNCYSQKVSKEVFSRNFIFDNGYFIDTFLLKRNSTNDINFLKSSVYIFFTKSSSVMLCNLGISDTDSSNFECLTKRILLKDFYGVSWGKFNVEKNIIKVHFCYQFFSTGLKLKYFDAYFEGIIRDETTIINWRMVAPYPNVNKRLNDNYEDLKIGKTLKFVLQKGINMIHSDKAWINSKQ
ncbi:MAG: hypothetical protein JNL13_09800 [Chitinophagaceae bacterium]|nr:hypothetical protein [Chitinophagaceae bacterium]